MLLKTEDIKNLLMFCFNKKLARHRIKKTQSKLHRMGSFDVCKTSLPSFDEKRYILHYGINILAYFHKDIRRQ